MCQNIRMKKMLDLKAANIALSKINLISERWAITGGANLFYRGALDLVNDIDIITTKSGVVEIANILNLNINDNLPIRKTTSGNVKSYFIKITCDTVDIEIMGAPENIINGQWVSNSFWNDEVEYIQLSDCIKLPLTTLNYELEINSQLNNKTRVLEIKKYNKKINATLKSARII